jgi:hypothetical protein
LLVYSEQAYQREKKTLEKNLRNKEDVLTKAIWHLGNELFDSDKAALSALNKVEKKYPLHTIKNKITPVLKYAKRGKPKRG